MRKEVQHTTVHFIKTTAGPPEGCRPRRLAPDKLKAAKAKLDLLLKEGIIQKARGPHHFTWHLKKKIHGVLVGIIEN